MQKSDTSRRVLIINLKNYPEVLGDSSSSRMLRAAELAAEKTGARIMLAPPAPFLSSLAARAKVPILSQSVDDAPEGKSTGAVIPAALLASRCTGSIINHSERRIIFEAMARVVPKMKELRLLSCVCVENPEELTKVAALAPELIAVEPPELIGSGISVSRARPELVSDSVRAAKASGYGGLVLCGAGIVSEDDVRASVALGAEGVLVASSIVKAVDWERKVGELASALVSDEVR